MMLRIECYSIIFLVGVAFFGGQITPTEASDPSIINTMRLGDQITTDMLDQLKSFQAILNQPISLGLIGRGGKGSPGRPGPPGKTGGRGTTGDEGPIEENGSDAQVSPKLPSRSPGPPGEPGTPGYKRTYDGWRNLRARYANIDTSNEKAQQRNYEMDKSLIGNTKVFCEGERSWIGCKRDERINITNAFWGRDDFVTCSQRSPGNHTTRQYSLDYDVGHVLMKVKEICHWRLTCEFYATRLFLDDVTDSQVYKYLRVMYECIPGVYDEDNFGERRHSTDNVTASAPSNQ